MTKETREQLDGAGRSVFATRVGPSPSEAAAIHRARREALALKAGDAAPDSPVRAEAASDPSIRDPRSSRYSAQSRDDRERVRRDFQAP